MVIDQNPNVDTGNLKPLQESPAREIWFDDQEKATPKADSVSMIKFRKTKHAGPKLKALVAGPRAGSKKRWYAVSKSQATWAAAANMLRKSKITCVHGTIPDPWDQYCSQPQLNQQKGISIAPRSIQGLPDLALSLCFLVVLGLL